MQLFELVSPRLFRPLAGPNRAFYAELLLLLWEECRHTADYSISRAEAVSRAEDYFAALAKPLVLDADGLPPKDSAGSSDLKSVRTTAQQHDGSMTLHWEAGWCTLRVLLPLPQTH